MNMNTSVLLETWSENSASLQMLVGIFIYLDE